MPRLLMARVTAALVGLACALGTVSSGNLVVTRVGPDDDLQAALNDAQPGEQILLEPGARYVGNFVLPAKAAAAAWVTLRSAAADSDLPARGERITPGWAGKLPILQSPNGDPVLRTAPGAHHWILLGLEFRANADGAGDIIRLGDGSTAQSALAAVPHDLVVDRVYVHGDPALGQKRGIALNSASTEIVNSWVSDIKGVGVETQAIASWNGPGPFALINNYLEAAGVNVMFGGGDPAIPGLVATGIDVRRNTFFKPLAWKDGVVATPAHVSAVAAAAGGTLPAGTYTYRVVAERGSGQQTVARSAASVAVSAQIARDVTTGAVALTWDPVVGAEAYRVYRSGPAGSVWWRTPDARFVDTGAGGAAGAPSGAATAWLVKNLFELKNARQVRVEGNIFQNNWTAGQPGYAILLTPRNQDGAASWAVLQDVRVVSNLIRAVSSVFNITGTDDRNQSDKATSITIRNNLAIDIDKAAYGGQGDFVQIGHGPDRVTIEHNTVVHTGRMIAAYGGTRAQPVPITGFTFRANVLRHNEYGIIGSDYGIGMSTIRAYFPGGVFTDNVVAGGDQSKYPLGNVFVNADEFLRLFSNPAEEDYSVAEGARIRGIGTDGLDPGVDMNALRRALGTSGAPK